MTKKKAPKAGKKKATGGKAKAKAAVTFMPAASFAAATGKSVVFTCSNPSCIVGITVAGVEIVFVGTGSAMLPPGTHTMFYRVQGSGAYDLTVSGATLSAPISSTAPDAGVRMLTV